MLKNQDTILVVPNKWAYVNANGDPSALVLRDNKEDGPGFLGATIDGSTGKITYRDTPVKCRATKYHRDRIVRGELFLASPEVAHYLGITYREPKALLAEAKAKAIADFDAQHGEGAWLSLHPEESQPTKRSSDRKLSQ